MKWGGLHYLGRHGVVGALLWLQCVASFAASSTVYCPRPGDPPVVTPVSNQSPVMPFRPDLARQWEVQAVRWFSRQISLTSRLGLHQQISKIVPPNSLEGEYEVIFSDRSERSPRLQVQVLQNGKLIGEQKADVSSGWIRGVDLSGLKGEIYLKEYDALRLQFDRLPSSYELQSIQLNDRVLKLNPTTQTVWQVNSADLGAGYELRMRWRIARGSEVIGKRRLLELFRAILTPGTSVCQEAPGPESAQFVWKQTHYALSTSTPTASGTSLTGHKLQLQFSAASAAEHTVNLVSSAVSVLQLPSRLSLPAGATVLEVPVTLTGQPGQALVTAVIGTRSTGTVVSVANAKPQITRLEPLNTTVAEQTQAQSQVYSDRLAVMPNDYSVRHQPADLVSGPEQINMPAGQSLQTLNLTAGTRSGWATLAVGDDNTIRARVVVTQMTPSVARLKLAEDNMAQLKPGAQIRLNIELSAVQNTDTPVLISANNPAVLTVPETVIVPAGRQSVTLNVTGVNVGTAELQARLGGAHSGPTRRLTLAVKNSTALSVLAPALQTGALSVLSVSLNTVQSTDTVVTLTSSASSLVGVASQVTIPAGETQAYAWVRGLAAGNSTVTATALGQTTSATVAVNNAAPSSVSWATTALSLPKGRLQELTLKLQRATNVPVTISLNSSAPTVLALPSQVTFLPGQVELSVPVVALGQGSATLTANLGANTSSLSAQAIAPVVEGFSIAPTTLTLTAGTQGTLTARAHLSDGTTQDVSNQASWSSSNTSVATVNLGNVNALNAGSSQIQAQATFNGDTYSAGHTLTVTPANVVLSLLGNTSFSVGQTSNITVSRATPAPAGGVNVSLSMSGTAISAPASVLIPAGQTSATFVVTGVATGSASVAASANGHTVASLNFTISAPVLTPTISALTPNQGKIQSLVTITGTQFATEPSANQVSFAGDNNTRVPAVVLTASATQLTVRVPETAVTGNVRVQTANGLANGPVFTVQRDQDVSFTASPASLTVYQGASAMVSLNLASTGPQEYTGLMQLSISNLPAGVSAKFTPTHLTRGQNGTLTLTATSAAALASAQALVITATNVSAGEVGSKSANLSLNVAAATGVSGVKGRFVTPQGAGIAGFRVAYQDGSGNLVAQTQSDAAGNFTLTGLPAGNVTLRMDGTPANPLYPIWPYTFNHPGNQLITLNDWVINPPPTDDKFTPINNTAQPQILKDERFPGLEITLPAGVSIVGWDGVPKSRIAIERVTPELLPVPTPPFPMKEAYQLYFGTPMGGIPSAPIPVTLPNVAEAEPGTILNIWFFDGSPMGGTGEWKIAGQGRVSDDGKTVSTLPGQGIARFCGVCGLVSLECPPPPEPPRCNNDCPKGPKGGNPVDLYTGQEAPQSINISLPGLNPVDLSMSYNPVDSFNGRAGTFGSMGLGWTVNYDIAFLPFDGPQKRLIMPGGNWINFTEQNGSYKVVNHAGYDGVTLTQTSTAANTWNMKFKDGRIWKFAPFPGITGLIRGGAPTFVTEMIDAQGNSTFITRQSNGRINTVGTNSRNVQFTYGTNGFVSELRDSANRTTRLTYTPTNRIASVTDADNKTTTYTYVDDTETPADIAACGTQATLGERIKSITYPGKTTPTVNHYGVAKRVLRQTLPDGREYRFQYQVTGACVTHISQPGVRCTGPQCPSEDTWEHHQAGWRIHGGQVIATRLLKPDGTEETHRFAADGTPTQKTDTQGQTTRYQYDSLRRLVKVTDPLGRVTRYEYDDKSNRILTIDPLQRLTRLTYDGKWNSVTSTARYNDPTPFGQANPQIRQQSYALASGVLTSTTTALNHSTSYEYTPQGLLSRITSPLGHSTRLDYNVQGDLIQTTDPLGNTTQMSVDPIGRPIRQTNPLGNTSQTQYNATDQPTQLTDALGQVTQIDYDAAGRIRRILDPRGNALEAWEYDDGDRPIKRTDALGQTDTWAYNSAGQLTSQTNRNGQTTTYSYDTAGRLASLTRPEGTQTLTYDSVGRVTQVQDSATNSAVRYDYDLVDRVTRQIHTVGSRVTELRYRYDSLDRLMERRLTSTAPEGNLGPDITTYTWDNDDRLTQVQFQAGSAAPLTTTYTWDNDDRLANKTLANGITVTYTYDAASRLTRLVYRNSTAQVLEDITYTYDAAGQRTARSSTNPLGANDTPLQASYDANNRLTSLTLNPGTPQAKTYTLSYNPAGSLTSKVNNADANDRTTYTWDSQQRLTQVSTPEHTATYQYDLLGRRVQRQITKPGFPPETTHYVYDGLQAVGEIRPQQSSTSLMTGLNLDEMLARVTTLNATNTTQARTYLTDALGSVMAQTQDNQSTLAGYSYSPYGQTQSTGNTEGDSVQYTARENDNNGLYYYRARYYDPVLKRFLSEDPIGLAGGSLSFYTYVNGNPVSLTDPLGLQAYMCQNAGLGAWCPKPKPKPKPPIPKESDECIQCVNEYVFECQGLVSEGGIPTGIGIAMCTLPTAMKRWKETCTKLGKCESCPQ